MALGGGGGGGQAGGIKAGRAYVELGVKSSLSGDLAAAEQKFNAVGKRLGQIGGGLTLGGLGLAGSLIRGANETLSDLAKMDSAAKAFGTSGVKLSGLFGALKGFGGDFKEDLEGLIQFGGKFDQALTGDGQGAKLFEGLSVSAQSLIGVPIEEKFLRIHAAIRELPQEDQLAKLSLVGGTDSVKKWQAILAVSNDELREKARLNEKSQEDLDQATAGAKAYAAASLSIQLAWEQIAIGVAPAIVFLNDAIQQILTPTIAWLRENRELASVLALVGVGMIALGGLLIVAAVGFKALAVVAATTAAIVKISWTAAWAAVFSPVTIGVAVAVAAIAGLGYVFITQTEEGRLFGEKVSGYFNETAENAKAAWGGIANAIRGGDLELAAKIGLKLLVLEFERFSNAISDIWHSISDGWSQFWDDAKYITMSVAISLVEFMETTFRGLFSAILDPFKKEIREFLDSVNDLISQLPSWAQTGLKIAMPGAFLAKDLLTAGVATDDETKARAKQFQAQRNAIQKELQDAEDARKNAGAGRDAAAAARIAALNAELAALNKQAAELPKPKPDEPPKPDKPPPPPPPLKLPPNVGLFQTGGLASQAFGDRAVNLIPAAQLKELQKNNALLGSAIGFLGVIAAKPAGLKFGV